MQLFHERHRDDTDSNCGLENEVRLLLDPTSTSGLGTGSVTHTHSPVGGDLNIDFLRDAQQGAESSSSIGNKDKVPIDNAGPRNNPGYLLRENWDLEWLCL